MHLSAVVPPVKCRKIRTMGEGFRSMICADGFVAARSTLRHVVSHHSSAERMCFPGSVRRKARDSWHRAPRDPGIWHGFVGR
ncbi:unnamed protein product [Ectocarpus fasciculatus]